MIRPARLSDIHAISSLLGEYARQGLLLPRSKQSISEHLLAFRVFEVGGMVLGTAALHVLGDDLAEIRSLAVVETAQGQGVGRQLVETLFAWAEELEVPRVLALTYQERFFSRLAFEVIEKSTLHQKIWRDCINCKMFPACNEIAMVRRTAAGRSATMGAVMAPSAAERPLGVEAAG